MCFPGKLSAACVRLSIVLKSSSLPPLVRPRHVACSNLRALRNCKVRNDNFCASRRLAFWHLQQSAVRFNSGGLGSFVSADGL